MLPVFQQARSGLPAFGIPRPMVAVVVITSVALAAIRGVRYVMALRSENFKLTCALRALQSQVDFLLGQSAELPGPDGSRTSRRGSGSAASQDVEIESFDIIGSDTPRSEIPSMIVARVHAAETALLSERQEVARLQEVLRTVGATAVAVRAERDQEKGRAEALTQELAAVQTELTAARNTISELRASSSAASVTLIPRAPASVSPSGAPPQSRQGGGKGGRGVLPGN